MHGAVKCKGSCLKIQQWHRSICGILSFYRLFSSHWATTAQIILLEKCWVAISIFLIVLVCSIIDKWEQNKDLILIKRLVCLLGWWRTVSEASALSGAVRSRGAESLSCSRAVFYSIKEWQSMWFLACFYVWIFFFLKYCLTRLSNAKRMAS